VKLRNTSTRKQIVVMLQARAHGEHAHECDFCDGRKYVYQAGVVSSVTTGKNKDEQTLMM
jgi:hypothetical protein